MRSSTSLIGDLEAAIHSGSPERRAEMLRGVTSLFLGNATNLNEEQVDIFNDVLGQLVKQVESNILAEVSAKLAPVDNAPRTVIHDLAYHDEIDVAGPVLAQSPLLSNQNLVEIARTKSQGHLSAISERKLIAAAVTDILVERGNTSVVHKLSQNQGASFSEVGFTRLTERAETDSHLAGNLIMRRDVPPQMLQELVAKATDEVRNRLAAKLPPEGRRVMESLVASVSKRTLGAATQPRDFTRAEAAVEKLQEKNQLNEKTVLAFANAGQYEEMVAGLARLCSAPIDLVESLLQNPRYDGVLVICKSSNLHWETLKAILANRFSHRQATPDELERARVDFIKLSGATAQRVMRFWLVRGAAQKGGNIAAAS